MCSIFPATKHGLLPARWSRDFEPHYCSVHIGYIYRDIRTVGIIVTITSLDELLQQYEYATNHGLTAAGELNLLAAPIWQHIFRVKNRAVYFKRTRALAP